MNPRHLKLVLAITWLVPGLALLAMEAWNGHVFLALPIGNVRIPLSCVFLLFAAFNGLRWWAGRSTRARTEQWSALRRRPRLRRDEPPTDPDPNFQFDDSAQ